MLQKASEFIVFDRAALGLGTANDWSCLLGVFFKLPSHVHDALIESDLHYVQGHSLEASKVKCLAQEHKIIWHLNESNRQPSSDEYPDSLTAQPSDSLAIKPSYLLYLNPG